MKKRLPLEELNRCVFIAKPMQSVVVEKEPKTFTANGNRYTYKEYVKYSIATHSGKMGGIPSISTSTLCNGQCAKNSAVKGSICEKCYARGLVGLRDNLAEKLKSNYHFYTTVDLKREDVPYINSAIFRFEAFGDLANVRQFANYCTIAEANPQTRFVLWSKNYHIIEDALRMLRVEKPSNLYIIASSLMLNEPLAVSPLDDTYIDAVFTVYDKETIKAENIDINCGGRKCLECRRCYSLIHGQIADIREQLK